MYPLETKISENPLSMQVSEIYQFIGVLQLTQYLVSTKSATQNIWYSFPFILCIIICFGYFQRHFIDMRDFTSFPDFQEMHYLLDTTTSYTLWTKLRGTICIQNIFFEKVIKYPISRSLKLQPYNLFFQLRPHCGRSYKRTVSAFFRGTMVLQATKRHIRCVFQTQHMCLFNLLGCSPNPINSSSLSINICIELYILMNIRYHSNFLRLDLDNWPHSNILPSK